MKQADAYDTLRQCIIQLKEVNPSDLPEQVGVIQSRLFELKSVLSSYHQEQLAQALRPIQQRLAERSAARTFSFKGRMTKPKEEEESSTSNMQSLKKEEDKLPLLLNKEPLVIRGRTGSIVNVQGPAVKLEGLTDCEVHTSAESSLFVDHCQNCQIFGKARQLRIAHSNACTFRVLCYTPPVIEHSDQLCFGPPDLKIIDQIIDEEEEEALKNKLYEKVKDFNWLKSAPSPHWKLIE